VLVVQAEVQALLDQRHHDEHQSKSDGDGQQYGEHRRHPYPSDEVMFARLT